MFNSNNLDAKIFYWAPITTPPGVRQKAMGQSPDQSKPQRAPKSDANRELLRNLVEGLD